MIERESLKEFKKHLIKDVYKKIDEKQIPLKLKNYVELFELSDELSYLAEFIIYYIYSLDDLEDFSMSSDVELFFNKTSFLNNLKNKDNTFCNFFNIDGYPFFSFILRKTKTNEGKLGILYRNKDKFETYLLKTKKEFINLEFLNEDDIYILSDKTKILASFYYFLEDLKQEEEKEKYLEDFEEFLSLISSLNEKETNNIINPIGENLFQRLEEIFWKK